MHVFVYRNKVFVNAIKKKNEKRLIISLMLKLLAKIYFNQNFCFFKYS